MAAPLTLSRPGDGAPVVTPAGADAGTSAGAAAGLAPRAYRDLMGASPLPLAVLDPAGHVTEANQAFALLLDTSIAQLRHRDLQDLTDVADRGIVDAALEALTTPGIRRPPGRDGEPRAASRGTRATTIGVRLLDAAGQLVPITAHLSARGDGSDTHLLLAAVDLRPPALAPGVVEHAATHDPLTGLLNRAGLMGELQRLLDDGRRASLALLDLDVLGPVDEAYGHGVGDQLLRRVAEALADLTHPDGLACRLAGDEFVVIADTDDEIALARFLTEQLARLQVEVAPGVVLASVPSVGTSPVHAGLTPGQVLSRADESMYVVKQRRQDALSWA